MSNHDKRLTRLENQIAESKADSTMIFLEFMEPGPDGPRQVPVDGWRIGHAGPVITRQAGESEEELKQRAEAAALATGSGPFLMIQATTTKEA